MMKPAILGGDDDLKTKLLLELFLLWMDNEVMAAT